MNKVDEWFVEVCGICTQTKIVHDDKTSKFDNPSFICKECEDLRMSFLNKYFSTVSKMNT